MHELSVVQNIIRISCEEAEKHGAEVVKEIRIKVGELSGLIPSCIQAYFDIASRGTKVEGALLKIEKVSIAIRCNECGYEGELPVRYYTCSMCNSYNIKVTRGKEFLIDSLEVE
jgi:hydrogenase nickel incorporation protein HypA/HybF